MSNLQPNWYLKIDFQKVVQHAGGKWLIHDTKRHKDNQLQSLKLPWSCVKPSPKRWSMLVFQLSVIVKCLWINVSAVVCCMCVGCVMWYGCINEVLWRCGCVRGVLWICLKCVRDACDMRDGWNTFYCVSCRVNRVVVVILLLFFVDIMLNLVLCFHVFYNDQSNLYSNDRVMCHFNTRKPTTMAPNEIWGVLVMAHWCCVGAGSLADILQTSWTVDRVGKAGQY